MAKRVKKPSTGSPAANPPWEVVGFTGSRSGMDVDQMSKLAFILKGAKSLHHGDDRGSDKQAHQLATEYDLEIEVHPPEDDKRRAFCIPRRGLVHLPRPYLDRNVDILKACDVLVGAPRRPEYQRSGTWYTIRQARFIERPTIVIYPGGHLEIEDFGFRQQALRDYLDVIQRFEEHSRNAPPIRVG